MPYPTACTGNCNQGRMCDCAADTDQDDPPEAPLTALEAAGMVAIYAASACVAGWVLYIIVRATMERWA